MTPKTLLTTTRNQGVALVVVLSMLVLATGLVVAFFLTVTNDATSSSLYSNDVQTKSLADSAVNLVTGQIVEATKGFATKKDGSPDYDNLLAWASQPGAIRTYQADGGEDRTFKLYSAKNMVLKTPDFKAETANKGSSEFDSADVPSDWDLKPSLYTDLNAPVSDEKGSLVYPIVDPAAADLVKGTTNPTIDGFSINKNVPKAPGDTANLAPMPVQWLYVLKDGAISSPTKGTDKKAEWDGGNQPTTENPIVSRIAFWTDDESTKININTASEGTFWDTPRTASLAEYNFAFFQPANREYQRYPGHPATTSLSPVFWSLWGMSAPTDSLRANPADATTNADNHGKAAMKDMQKTVLQNTYAVTPRNAGDRSGLKGSKNGTVDTSNQPGNPGVEVAVPDGDRLYASIDDFIFNTERKPNDAALNKSFLQKAKFFLTASSRAPDVNLFNEPKVSIWPITSGKQTPLDKTLAFCSTVKGFPYYFLRSDPNSNDDSFAGNERLYNYIRSYMGRRIPGFGKDSTGKEVTFEEKYTKFGSNQITSGIYDYIRSCVNLMDNSMPGVSYTPLAALRAAQVVPFRHPRNGTGGFGRFVTLKQVGLVFMALQDSETTKPSVPPDPKDAPAQLAADTRKVKAMFIFDPVSVTPGWAGKADHFKISITGLKDFKVHNDADNPAAEAINPFPATADGEIEVRFGPGALYNRARSAPAEFNFSNVIGFTSGFPGDPFKPLAYPFVSDEFVMKGSSFKFTGGPITIVIKEGSTNQVVQTFNLDMPSSKNDDPEKPNRWPAPIVASYTHGLKADDPAANAKKKHGYTWEERIKMFNRYSAFMAASRTTPAANNDGIFENTFKENADTIRTIEEVSGDLRMIASLETVPSGMFKPNVDYQDRKIRGAHSLRGNGGAWRGARQRPLTNYTGPSYNPNGKSYYSVQPKGDKVEPFKDNDIRAGGPPFKEDGDEFTFTQYPNVSSHANLGSDEFYAKWQVSADYDQAGANFVDGPYINKADEGDSTNGSTPVRRGYYDSQSGVFPILGTMFSPNRQVASAVTFGSLPTGIREIPTESLSFQTLLFCPNPNSGSFTPLVGSRYPDSHRSLLSGPRDHLLLDLFNMPVVEPYPISEPLSTAGRINMNYQIQPFSYIKRDTGMRAVLKSVMLAAIPDKRVYDYMGYFGNATDQPNWSPGFPTDPGKTNNYWRYPIHATETLKAFDKQFETDIFRSPTQICDIFLYPAQQPTVDDPTLPKHALITWNFNGSNKNIKDWWYQGGKIHPERKSLTGDNMRERPYGVIYPRLTTKSNSFTVHFRVQALKKVPSTKPAEWVEGRDLVQGEYRGSTLIERYVDPNDSRLPDFADPGVESKDRNIDQYYRFRTVSTKKFAP